MTAFSIMTFNLRGSFFEIDGKNYWPHRAAFNVATIQHRNPDIISFQEFQSGNFSTYHEHLKDYDCALGPKTIDQEDWYMQNAIYWKRDRFEQMATGSFYLSETPDRWSLSWDSLLVRAANWVRLRCLHSGDEFLLLNTHLDHLGETARVEGAKLIVRQIAQLRTEDNVPVIVTGDFNSRTWAPPDERELPADINPDDISPPGTVHRVFIGAGYRDTFLEAGHSEGYDTNTFHDFRGKEFPAYGLRIDWILTLDGVHQFTTHACDIIRDEEPPLFPSDHYPVIAELTLQ